MTSAARDSRSVLTRLLGYIKPHRATLIGGLVCAALAGTIPAGVAKMVKRFADQAASGDANGVLPVALSVVGLYGLLVGLRYGQTTLLAEVTQRVGLDLRRSVYAHLQKMSLAYFHAQRTGALMAALTNDVTRLQNAANLMRDGVALPITALTMLWLLVSTSPRLLFFTVAVLPIMAFIIQRITRRLRAISTEAQTLQAEVNAIMDETLSAPRIVKAFVAEEREVARFDAVGAAAMRAQMRGIRRSAWLSPAVDFVGAIAMALVLYFGANEIVTHAHALPEWLARAHADGLTGKDAEAWADANAPGISLGAFLQFVMAANELARSVSGMGNLRGAWQEMLGAADRVFDQVLDVPPGVEDAPDATALGPIAGNVEFSCVRFGYDPAHTVLDGIDLVVQPGEVVALVGPPGSGKSTLADLVPRFIDPDEGVVRIDGHDLRTVTQASLRRQVAIVPQRTVLFAGTIRDNIAYGRPDATQAEVEAAAKAANAHEFIIAGPSGYATTVAERGTTLSGGQAQRVAIARALLADPRVLILDEATSALDTATEALVQAALDRLMEGRTTLVIAHRLSTIVSADRIVVLKEGKIEAVGTHAELMAQGGYYARQFEIQRQASEIGETVSGAFEDEDMGA